MIKIVTNPNIGIKKSHRLANINDSNDNLTKSIVL